MNRYFIYCALTLLLISCTNQKSEVNNPDLTVRSFSESYLPPVFSNDDRKLKIQKLAPEIEQLIKKHAIDKNIPGIAYGIVVDNELIIASATGLINLDNKLPAARNSSFRIASMTKSFTAMAIMKLRDEGKLSLSDPASKYIPEMAGLKYLTSDAPTIEIKNLLTMTAGFPEDNPWGDRQLDEPDKMLIDLISNGISFSNVPSFEYEYSNTGYALLGNIITKVSGIPFQEYISENILLQLGMEHTYWEYSNISENQLVLGYRWEDEQWKKEPMLHDGSYGAMGGLITSIEDFAKYVSFHLSAWPPRSGEDSGPVKRSTLREMQSPQFSRLYLGASDWNGKPCPGIAGYGYGLAIIKNCSERTRISHGGALPGFGSNYVFFPEYGVGVMAFCNLTYTSPYPIQEIEHLLFDVIRLQARKLPVSDILAKRKEQVIKLIQDWDSETETEILAENFYMDKSRKHRMKEIQDIFEKAGTIKSIESLDPDNQLRGTVKIHTQNGIISIFFTLSPENNPKIQEIDVYFKPVKSE
jgi:CubicO group peptidase (beta-lactamase class C family)